jgi:hypothetical protein
MRDLIKNLARFTLEPALPFQEEDDVTIRISFPPQASGKDGGPN